MEVAAQLNTKEKETVLVTDGEEGADECNHFTLRGYVAGVRKRDAKICWPLFMPINEGSDILSNMLPPLHVSKFKRWSCLNCLHTISTSADVTGNADFANVQNGEIKTNNLILSNVNAKRLYSGSKQPSENIILGKRLVSDSSIIGSHGECSLAPCHGKKENESTTKDKAKEGIQVFICGNFRSEENQDWSCKHISALAEGEEFQAGQNQTRNMTVSENKSETAFLCGDASPMVCAKKNGGTGIRVSNRVLTFRGTDLAAYGNEHDEGITAEGSMNIMPDGIAKESRKLVGVDLRILKDDALNATAANVTNYDLIALDQSNYDASYGIFSSSHGKVNHKKVHKLRLLEDIMKSEELHLSKRANSSKGNAVTCEIKNNLDEGSDGLTCEAQPGESKATNPPNGIEANQNKDEELSLMHWLKKVSKKFISHDSQKKKTIAVKGYAEIKCMEKKIGTSHSAHNEKDINPLLGCSSVSKHNKNYTVEKENKVPRLKPSGHCLMTQHKNLISKDATVIYPKMRNVISANILPPGLGNLDTSYDQKAEFNIRKKKASRIEDRNSSQINWPKKQVTKKRRITTTNEKETPDDIPMDIVELLAKNQHERSLMNAEVANKNKHELSMMNIEMRHGNDPYASRYCGSKCLNAIYKRHATSNDTGFDIPSAPHGNQNAVYGPEASKLVKYQKHIFIDLNQQAKDFLTIPEYSGHQSRTNHFSAVDSKEIHSLQNSSWDRIRMQDLGSYQKDQGVSANSSSGHSPDMLSPPLNGRIFGVSNRNIDTYCNYRKKVPFDSFLDRIQRTVAQKTDYQEPMNLSGPQLLYGGGKSEQSTNRLTLSMRSFLMEEGNRCHSGRTGLIDLHTNEMISAQHLLRLVDQAALSGASWNINYIGTTQDSNVNCNNESTGMLGVEVGVRNRETPENPLAAGYSAHDQNEGNFSKPLRPVPRIGVLGSLLQKEIMTHSNKYMAPLGSTDWCSGDLPSFCIDGTEKTDGFSSAINTEYGESKSHPSSTKQIVKAGDSLLYKFEIDQVGISKKNGPIKSLRHDRVSVNCIVNQNPADFSLPDADNVYMRGSEVATSKCMFPHKNPWSQNHHDGQD